MVRAAVASALLITCVGAGCPQGEPGPGAAAATDGPRTRGEAEPDEPEEPEEPGSPLHVDPASPRLRLLSAAEYRLSVRALLGVEASPTLAWADASTGYDSGAAAYLDENLFVILLAETDRIADVFVRERMSAQFPCFDPANVRESCVLTVIDTLGARAFRHPVDEATRGALLTGFREAVDASDPLAPATCDAATQLAPHWGDKDGRCRPSCGAIGGTHCPATSGLCDEGSGAVGVAFDCDVCCGPGGGFTDDARVTALRGVVTRILLSPQFLYRAELGTAGVLDPFERAALISYALTGAGPDELLRADASADTLGQEQMRGHIRRLLAGPEGHARIAAFIQQWVRGSALDDMVRSPSSFPKLAADAQALALRDELHAYVQDVLFNGTATLPALLTDTHTFVNEHTAPLYGLSVAGPALTRVDVDPNQRAGLFTLASVMAAHASSADPARDRPVKRGLLVVNQLLCEDIGPPSGIDTAAAAAQAAAENPDIDWVTTREQFEAMMQQGTNCAGCHQDFMPHGFAFGRYDALGRFVTHTNGLPIDPGARGLFVEGKPGNYPDALSLMRDLAARDVTARCFVRNWLSWTLGVAHGPTLEGLTEELGDRFVRDDKHILTLIEDSLVHPDLHARRRP